MRLLAFTDQATATAWHTSAVSAVSHHSAAFPRSPSGPVKITPPAVPSHTRHASMPAVSPTVVPSSRLMLSHDSGFADSPAPAPMDTPPGDPNVARVVAAIAGRASAAPARPTSPTSEELVAFHTALDSSWTHVSSTGGDCGSGSMAGVPRTPQYAQTSTRSSARVDRVSDLWPEVRSVPVMSVRYTLDSIKPAGAASFFFCFFCVRPR